MSNTNTIAAYHAHIYFDADTVKKARVICEQATELFGVSMGRMHEKPVGPHPMWSCQMGASPEQFASLLPWLALNRDGLIVFAHPDSGDALKDHRDHGIWLGTGLTLNMSVFN